MQGLWRRFREDETGLIISSELVLVGTIGVLGMIVGLEAVSSAVIQELNDLSHAFGSISQSFNFRSIAKLGHARVSGSGFNDMGDFCDCVPITHTEVFGRTGNAQFGGVGGPAIVSPGPIVGGPVIQSGPIVQERVLPGRVIEEVIVEQPPCKVVAPVCCDAKDEIIEEHIIRRRVHPDCATSPLPVMPSQKQLKPLPEPKPKLEKVEPKPKKNG